MPAGRPTKYKEEYAEQVYKLCLLGHTDKELAGFFEVSESTLNLWKEKEEFSESIKRGKEIADGNVAEALYHRAIGYTHSEEKVFCSNGEITTHRIDKHYPPDTGAAALWLKNRKAGQWKDNRDVVIDITTSEISEEDALKKLAELGVTVPTNSLDALEDNDENE